MRIHKYIIILSALCFVLFGSLSYLGKGEKQDLTVMHQLHELNDSLQNCIASINLHKLDDLSIKYTSLIEKFNKQGLNDSIIFYQKDVTEMIEILTWAREVQKEISLSNENIAEIIEFAKFQRIEDSLLMQAEINEAEILYGIEYRVYLGLEKINNYICKTNKQYLCQILNEKSN